MIFVTVGTHEQQFNRLIECIDHLKAESILKDDIFVQTGFSTYTPCSCEWKKILPYNEMVERIKTARIVVTHGGPSSFLLPLQMDKVPVVVPRAVKYGEHVNDHQITFVKEVTKRFKNIIPVYSIEDLKDILISYNDLSRRLQKTCLKNNDQFIRNFEKLVNKLLDTKEHNRL